MFHITFFLKSTCEINKTQQRVTRKLKIDLEAVKADMKSNTDSITAGYRFFEVPDVKVHATELVDDVMLYLLSSLKSIYCFFYLVYDHFESFFSFLVIHMGYNSFL